MDNVSGARGKGTHPWVQVIVVDKAGTHEATVAAAAVASLAVGLDEVAAPEDRPAFDAWLSGPFTKTVRRGSKAQLAQVVEWARSTDSRFYSLSISGATAIGLVPMRYEDLPKPVSKLQVSGTDLARSDYTASPSAVRIAVLDSLTTGKAAAQAAHGLWKWALSEGLESLTVSQLDAEIQLVSATELADFAALVPDLAVYDNGLTEVDPHTLTATVMPV